MFKQIATATFTALTAITLSSVPIYAQTSYPQTPTDPTVILDLNRAKNLARQAAENANGGLGNYRAESSMHGPASESTYVANANGSWTFTFKGRRPDESTPSVESVVTVTKDSNVTVDYNGAIRSSGQ
ncbi:MAG TPA: hypothetical protein V6D14_06195 [Coleofasciculaceae cyanobacterium]|jgi:hypothetical protein